MRFDAHVDVFRHQDDAVIGMDAAVHDHGNDLVVGLASSERGRERGRDRFRLDEQPSAGSAALRGFEGDAGADVAGADALAALTSSSR
jgi:hypothetical protein